MQAQPKVHPLLIGAVYGLVAAVLQVATIYLNHAVLSKSNGILGFAGVVVLPFLALYLAGHYAGRHQRLTKIQTSNTGLAFQSVLSGLGAGVGSGAVYVILTALAAHYLPSILSNYPKAPNDVLAIGGDVIGLIVWIFLGLVGGTLGGVFGDSRAHTQIKKGQVPVATPAK